jgi:hypothetical protein
MDRRARWTTPVPAGASLSGQIINSVLLQMARGLARGVFRADLHRDTEQRVDELPLTYSVAFGDPSDPSLPDSIHCFVACDRFPCPARRTESQTRRDALLDKAMILLDDAV